MERGRREAAIGLSETIVEAHKERRDAEVTIEKSGEQSVPDGQHPRRAQPRRNRGTYSPKRSPEADRMSRGSACSWEPYARRSSANMMQLTGSRAEFVTSDEIGYKRKGGWFLSYAKTASLIVAFILGVVAAGFVGWYISSIPKRRAHDALALIHEELEDGTEPIKAFSISPYVHPSRYILEFTPVFNGSKVTRLKGRVIIEFRVAGTPYLNEVSLSAKNITATRYRLFSLNHDDDDDVSRRKREVGQTSVDANSDKTEGIAKITTISDLNQAASYENSTENPLANGTSIEKDSGMSSAKNVTSERIGGEADTLADRNPVEIEIKEYKVDEAKELHVIRPSVNIGEGYYSLDIDYELVVDGSGLYLENFGEANEDKWLMGTQLRSITPQYLFPVFDDVNLKAVFFLTVTRPKETKVLSNMALRTSRDISHDLVLDTFDGSPPLSPHNFAFTMGNVVQLTRVETRDVVVPVVFWGESDKASQGIYLSDKIVPTIARLTYVLSLPYPFSKLDFVGLPEAIDDVSSKPGLISIKKSLFYATEKSSLTTKTDVLTTLIRLVGRQWLGGAVNMRNWTDTWILEGSLLYLQHELIHEIDSSFDFSHSFVGDVQSTVMDVDGYSVSRSLHVNVNPIYLDPHAMENYYVENLYRKGACLIRMLRGAINATAFGNGYKNFVSRWRNETADASTLWNVMEEEASELPEGITLMEIMNSWIVQSGYPVVTVTRNYEDGSAIIRQERFTYDNLSIDDTERTWYIPLTYINENGNWSSPNITWFLSDVEKIVDDIDGAANGSWILFNVDKIGYYRVNYDEENWRLLATSLEENHESFPPETRASLVDDVLSLAAAGLAKYETAFGFIKYMSKKERHYAPWRVLTHHIFKLNCVLYETSAFAGFQEFMLNFISPLYAELGSKLGEGSQLTTMAVRTACLFEHTECLDWSTETFTKLKDNPATRESIPPYIRKTLYCMVARYGTRDEWNYFLENSTMITDREEKNRFLSSFACFQVPWILQSALNEVLHGETFNEDEIQVILRAFPRHPAAAQSAYRFIRANWQDIVRRFSKSRSLMKSFVIAAANGLTTEQDLQDLQALWENNYESMKPARSAAAVVEAHANFVITWLRNSLPEVQQWLKGNNDTDVISN